MVGDGKEGENEMLEKKKKNTNIGIGVGILLQIISRVLAQDIGIIAPILGVVGVVCFIWGCFNYAAGKGHSKWLGLLGLLSIIGLIILVILPDRCKQS